MSVTAAHLQNDNTSQNVDFLKNVSFTATQSKLHKIDEEPKQAALHITSLISLNINLYWISSWRDPCDFRLNICFLN